VWMGGISMVLSLIMNYLSHGLVIGDAVSALGVWIAFYYGLTGFACAWYYRSQLRDSTRNLVMKGIIPVIGGLMLYGILGWSFWYYWSSTRSASYTSWKLPFWPHQSVSGVFVIDILAILFGIVLMFACQAGLKKFFSGETLNKNTATLVTDDLAGLAPTPAGGD
ncbi:MAG TPA: hypothetical protein VGS21_11950, partial [Acidimicrobiales bacterium]|nr:hypothetical protein [Acidimicrobiales bacterium]